MRLLYVEDEQHMAEAVAYILKQSNYSIDLAHNGVEGPSSFTVIPSGVDSLHVFPLSVENISFPSIFLTIRPDDKHFIFI